MDRRNFILKSVSLLFGSFLGTHGFSHAVALAKSVSFSQPQIALIIDDIGYSFSKAKQFLDLNIPLTFSILPQLEKSYDLAVDINSRGHEIMLHQPMEPYGNCFDPGPGALYVGDKPEEITRVVEDNVACIPFAKGVNNHMGSRFTEQSHEINETLKVIGNQGMFFIDSLTSCNSLAFSTAKKLNMTAAFRNTFLDNINDRSQIMGQLQRLKQKAYQHGHSIGIGHPLSQTAKAIECFVKDPVNSDITLVSVSKVLKIDRQPI